MNTRKRIAMIAHDNRKHDLFDWACCNRGVLLHHDLFATGTTGAILAAELGLDITRFASGPLGGDQQVGAAIVEGRIDFVVFFSDPLEPHPADFLVSSPLMKEEYRRLTMGVEDQLVRWVQDPRAVS